MFEERKKTEKTRHKMAHHVDHLSAVLDFLDHLDKTGFDVLESGVCVDYFVDTYRKDER